MEGPGLAIGLFGFGFASLASKDSKPLNMRDLKGTNHGYGDLVSNLGRNNCLWHLGRRRDDRCRLAFGLDAHGTTCRHNRIDQPLWVGAGRQDSIGLPFSPQAAGRLPVWPPHVLPGERSDTLMG